MMSDIHLCLTDLDELDGYARTAGVKSLTDLGAGDDPEEMDEEDTENLTFFPPEVGQQTLRALLDGVKTKQVQAGDDEEQTILAEELQDLLEAMDRAIQKKRKFRFTAVY